jgi:hypothetical protein
VGEWNGMEARSAQHGVGFADTVAGVGGRELTGRRTTPSHCLVMEIRRSEPDWLRACVSGPDLKAEPDRVAQIRHLHI